MISVNPLTRSVWQSLFRKKLVCKEYLALAGVNDELHFPMIRESRLERDDQFFRMREVDGQPNSQTQISIIEQRGDHALYRLVPITGKMHQLRVHMNAVGLPIINDGFYPVALAAGLDDFTKPLKLLAKSITFIDPISGDDRQFTSSKAL